MLRWLPSATEGDLGRKSNFVLTSVKDGLLMIFDVRPTFNLVQKSPSLARPLSLCPGIISQEKKILIFKRDLLLSSHLELVSLFIGFTMQIVPRHTINGSQPFLSLLKPEKNIFCLSIALARDDYCPFLFQWRYKSSTLGLTIFKEVKARVQLQKFFSPPRNFCPGQQGRRPDEMRGHKLHRYFPASIWTFSLATLPLFGARWKFVAYCSLL